MRNVVNISLPQIMVKEIKTTVKKQGFASVSEFFRSLIRSWQEGNLLADIEQSRKEIKAGQGKILHSLKDLR